MKKRHSAEQIVAKLRQADVDLGKGLKMPEVCKQMGIGDLPYRTILTKPPTLECRTLFWRHYRRCLSVSDTGNTYR